MREKPSCSAAGCGNAISEFSSIKKVKSIVKLCYLG